MFNLKSTRKDAPSISFGGVITILITLATLVFTSTITDLTISWVKTFFFISIYFILALLSGSFPMISEIMANILTIQKENDLNSTEKIYVIKDHLVMFNDYFSKIFSEVRVIGKGRHMKKKDFATTTIYRIINGKITSLQSLWIILYISYLILVQPNNFNIPLPYNMIITIVFLGMLQLTSGNIRGLGSLIGDLYKTVKNDVNDRNESLLLSKIIHTIRILCLGYNRISKKIKNCTGMEVNDFMITHIK